MGGRAASPGFAGRIEELELLEAARRRAADEEPAVVLVGGEAGVGKTRLTSELTARCATDGTRVLTGGCVPVGEGALPYAPIVEMLRVLLADLGAGAVRGLVGPSWREVARLLPALGAPDRIGLSHQAAQARLFELLLGLFGRLSEQGPLVLVVEDLHWADRSTRDLLAFLVRNLHRERVLLVVTYRNDEPGQQQLGPTWPSLTAAARSSAWSCPDWIRPRRGHSWSGSWRRHRRPSWSMRCSLVRRVIRSSPRSCWRPCGLVRVSCQRPCATYSGAGSKRCLSTPGTCLRWRR
jgi:AAA ATPase domain